MRVQRDINESFIAGLELLLENGKEYTFRLDYHAHPRRQLLFYRFNNS